jgi:hypothetical protein
VISWTQITCQFYFTYWITLTQNLSEPAEKFTDWKIFQSFGCDLISPRIEISLEGEADKAARGFAASITLAHGLSTNEITLFDIKNHDLVGLDHLLKHKQRLQKLWQVTRDPACKMTVNWVKKIIGKMIRRKTLEQWERKIGKCEVTPQAVWPVVKSLIKRDGP